MSEVAGAGRIDGGVGWKIEFGTPDCQHGWTVTKGGTGQSIGCYLTEEEAMVQAKALAGDEPIFKGDQTKQDQQEGIGSLSFWNGAFAPMIGSQDQDMRFVSTYNAPPDKDGKPSVGYGNSSSPKGRSNS